MVNLSHESARTALMLAVAAVSPFILRSLGDFVISNLIEKHCGMTKKELTSSLIGKGDTDVTIKNIWNKNVSWTKARDEQHLNINLCAASFISIARFFFWHLMQPILYFFVFYAYWDLLYDMQRFLGQMVAIREGIYALLVLIAVYVNPAIFIVDLKASWNKDKRNTLMYVIAPEKFVYWGIIPHFSGLRYLLGFTLLMALDGAGIVAFVWALATDNVYPAMMIGYTITTMGFIYMAGWIMIKDKCC